MPKICREMIYIHCGSGFLTRQLPFEMVFIEAAELEQSGKFVYPLIKSVEL